MHRLKALFSRPKSEKPPPSSDEPHSRSHLTSKPQSTPRYLASNPQLRPNVKHQPVQSSNPSPSQIRRDVVFKGTSVAASTNKCNPALKKAMDRHIQQLSDADRIAFTKASADDINKLLERVHKLDEEHSQQSSFRRYTPRVINFLSIFQLSVGGVSVFLQAESTASIALGGAKLIIGLALRYVEYFDKVSDMLDQLSKYLAPLTRYAEKCDLPNICDALADVYADILRFYSAARRMFVDETGKAKKYASFALFLRSQWTPFDSEFGEIKFSLQGHKDVLLHAGVSEILVDSTKDKEELLGWLSTHNFEFKKTKSLEARHGSTCNWLFATREFEQWLSSTTSKLLWYHGKPGSGKSILASRVIQYLENRSPVQVGRSALCFTYFALDDLSFRGAEASILAWFKQLCRTQTNIPDWLLRAKRERRDPLDIATLENFIALTSSHEQTYIVLDGLDECPEHERRTVLSFIDSLRRQTKTIFKIFVTSRKEDDIADYFDCAGVLQLSTNTAGVSADIRSFVQQECLRLRNKPSGRKLMVRSDCLFDEIVSTLSDKADGMFLWVRLQLDRLCMLKSDSAIRAALNIMPGGLNNTYGRILTEISQKDTHQRTIAFTCFRWLLTAGRTLSWNELEVALALADPNSQTLEDSLTDTLPQTYVLSACGNLIDYTGGEQSRSGDTVAFAHSSVIQFLSSNSQKLGFKDEIWSSLSNTSSMQLQTASDCIRYMNHCVETLDSNPGDLEDILKSNVFARYAFAYFDKHVVACLGTDVDSSMLKPAIKQLLDQDEDLLGLCFDLRTVVKANGPDDLDRCIPFMWGPISRDHIIWTTELYSMFKDSTSWLPPDNTLYLIAANGILEPLQDLVIFIENGWLDINALDDYGCSALYYACAYGHKTIVEFLLCNGAHFQHRSAEGTYSRPVDRIDHRTPLCAAIRIGHVPIVERLLQAYVKAKFRVDSPRALDYPLKLAIERKQGTIAKLLMAQGADSKPSKACSPHAVAGASRE